MTTAVQELLRIFDALPEAERQEAALAILRHVTSAEGDLPEGTLLEAADVLFRTLESEEAANAGA